MTVINVSQNKFLTHLLSSIIQGLFLLNKNDPSMRQISKQLNTALLGSASSGEDLLSLLYKLKDIVASYNLKPNGDLPTGNVVDDLPGLLYNTIQELDNEITKEKILDKTSTSKKIASIWQQLIEYHLRSH